jgi:hypothetical protein
VHGISLRIREVAFEFLADHWDAVEHSLKPLIFGPDPRTLWGRIKYLLRALGTELRAFILC